MDSLTATPLPDHVAARLPPSAPPAPWATRLDAVVWWHRATNDAVDAVPPALRGRRRLGLTVAAFVAYAETPVGAYREILASPVILLRRPLPAVTVPFIAVDSPASVVGGRANWALPKTLAAFDGPPDGLCPAAHGDGWTVAAHARPRGPAVPVAILAADRQVAPGGRELATHIHGRGRARLARVEVRVSGAAGPRWLREGSHPGLVVSGAEMLVGAPG